jgi:hypothetical protein
MDNRVNYNFTKVFDVLLKTTKKTRLARKMGYTTTRQLDNVLAGAGSLSTMAIMNLVKNFNVNPTFLFTGNGSMFLLESNVENFKYTSISSTL